MTEINGKRKGKLERPSQLGGGGLKRKREEKEGNEKREGEEKKEQEEEEEEKGHVLETPAYLMGTNRGLPASVGFMLGRGMGRGEEKEGEEETKGYVLSLSHLFSHLEGIKALGIRRFVVICCYLLLFVVICCYLLLFVVICCCYLLLLLLFLLYLIN